MSWEIEASHLSDWSNPRRLLAADELRLKIIAQQRHRDNDDLHCRLRVSHGWVTQHVRRPPVRPGGVYDLIYIVLLSLFMIEKARDPGPRSSKIQPILLLANQGSRWDERTQVRANERCRSRRSHEFNPRSTFSFTDQKIT